MKKVFKVLKKYFVIAFILSIIILIWSIVPSIRSNTMPTINLMYIINVVFGILESTVGLALGIAMIDWFIIQAAKSLFKDYKDSDRKGKIIIIVVCIMILLRKILIWTR